MHFVRPTSVSKAEPASRLCTGKNGQGGGEKITCEEVSTAHEAATVQLGQALAGTLGRDLTQQIPAPPSKTTFQLNLNCRASHLAPGIADLVPGNQNTAPRRVPVLGTRRGRRLALGSVLRRSPGWVSWNCSWRRRCGEQGQSWGRAPPVGAHGPLSVTPEVRPRGGPASHCFQNSFSWEYFPLFHNCSGWVTLWISLKQLWKRTCQKSLSGWVLSKRQVLCRDSCTWGCGSGGDENLPEQSRG